MIILDAGAVGFHQNQEMATNIWKKGQKTNCEKKNRISN